MEEISIKCTLDSVFQKYLGISWCDESTIIKAMLENIEREILL